MSGTPNDPPVNLKGNGYEELLAMLKTRYPRNGELALNEFMDVEALLTLALEVGGSDVDASKADRLLANYPLLRPNTFGRQAHLMQMARRKLMALSSSTTWRKRLSSYLADELVGLRFFDVESGRIAPKEHPFGAVDRRPLYLERLLAGETVDAAVPVASSGRKYRYFATPETTGDDSEVRRSRGEERRVTIPPSAPQTSGKTSFPPHKGPRESITVSLDELIATAKDLGEKTGKAHYASVLKQVLDQGLLKEPRGNDAKPTDRITLDRVTNMVGLVGAGKSVLANTLTVNLAQRGYRVASIQNSVVDVFDLVAFLRQAGISASPLVSKGNRLPHLNEIIDQSASMLLDDDAARYLETPCLIDGLAENEAEACSYDSVPCRKLKSTKAAAHLCPYWDICPTQTMDREAITSSVVVTTPGGFSSMSAGKNKRGFFELALADFDLVLFDEADRVQSQLDSSFAPDMSFQDLIYNSADSTAAAMKRRPSDKMRDLNEEMFYDLRQQTEPVAKALLLSAKKGDVAGWKVVEKEAFTSLTLLNDLEERGLPTPLVDELTARINGLRESSSPLSWAIKASCQPANEEVFQSLLDHYLEQHDVTLSPTMRKQLAFLLKVIRFDEFLRELANASDYLSFKDESMSELYSFLRYSHVRQQRYLPSSLIGNVFGMRLDSDNELTLFRQFAFGRAFMDSLPWLDTNEEGLPTGPHVLLLSGSSYEPGCLQYHVNRPVDYLLEAQPWIAEKLSSSVVMDLGIEQNVSGSGTRFRSRNLGLVLSQLTETLCSELERTDSKILLIVNSYREAAEARERVETLLRQRSVANKVCALTKGPKPTEDSKEDKDRFILRSELYRFASHPARILVAPALAIERGFNIVDSTGHAAFGTLVLCVRPMGAPRDIGARYRKLNGLIEGEVEGYPDNPAEFAMELRGTAWARWKGFEHDELVPLSTWRASNNDILIRDTISTLMVTIVQVFGRLARLKDQSRPAPHVYFADAAFRGSSNKNVASFRTLDELGAYLQDLIENSEQPAVARALYGPFYDAFKKGIR